MKGLRRGLVLFVFLTLVHAPHGDIFGSVNDGEHVVWKIHHLIREKQEAVNQRDWTRLKRMLHPGYRTYVQEQKRWFEVAVRYVDPGSFRLKLVSIIPEKEHQIRAWARQSYRKNGVWHHVQYSLLFQETESGWKDSDLPFHHMTRGEVIVHYTRRDLEDQAAIALEAVTKGVHEFQRKYEWHPKRPVEVKLYHDPEVFRQSVKLSLPQWVGGWHESGQAIKFIGWAGHSDQKLFSSGIVHELTHQMVSELSGDNAAYWLQEGAAEYYQSHLLPGLRAETEGERTSPPWTFSQLESKNLEALPAVEADRYYSQCYDLFRYLVERYGEAKIKQVFNVLELSPSIDSDSALKRRELNRRTRAAVEKSLGLTMERLERDWLREMRKESKTDSITS